MCGPRSEDEIVIGIALTVTWMLATGRRLRCDVPLFHTLSTGDLIDFWADDHLEPGSETSAGLTEQAHHDPNLTDQVE